MSVARDYFAAGSLEGVLSLSMKLSAGALKFVGASVPTHAKPGSLLKDLYLFPDKPNQPGLVIVSVIKEGRGGACSWITFGFPIKWNGETPIVELDAVWMPKLSKPCQIHDCGLSFLVGDRRITTVEMDAANAWGLLLDANLACRYVNGGAEDQEVLDALQRCAEERSAIERLKELEPQLAETNRKLAAAEDANADWISEVERLNRQIAELQSPKSST